MKLLFSAFLLFCFTPTLYAQHIPARDRHGAVSGTVFSSASGRPQPFANIVILRAADSSQAGGMVTGENGAFKVEDLPPGKFILRASFIGLKSFDTSFTIRHSRQTVHLGHIKLSPATHELNEVSIVADRPAMQVKGDTISFNPGAYKTDPDASAEDLVGKITGLQTDGKGNIQSQGKPITRVLVDGKPFFEGNSKDALKMIPASILDKIEVMNDPDQEYDASNRDKPRVLNLVIKKDKKKGHYLNGYASAGNRGQVEGSFKGNILSGEKMFATRAGGNKGVQQSYNYYASPFFRNYVNEKFSYRVGMRYNYNTNEGYGNSRRQNFFGDTSYYVNQSNSSHSNAESYSAEGGFEYNPDSQVRVRFWQTLSTAKNNGNNFNEYTNTNESDSLLATGSRKNTSQSQAPAMNSNLNFLYRFKMPGRRIESNLAYNRHNNDAASTIYALRDDIKTGRRDTTDQHNQQNNTSRNISFRTNFITPVIRDRSSLNIGYSFSFANNLNDYSAYRNRLDAYRFDSLLSNRYRNHDYNHAVNIDYSAQAGLLHYWLGGGYQYILTRGVNFIKDSSYTSSRYSLYPRGGVKYDFTKFVNLELNYNGSLQPPSFEQLQPTINNTNPQHIFIGNPGLKPAFSNNFGLRFNSFSQKTMNTMNLTLNYHLQEDQIQNINTFDTATGVVTTQPQNVPSHYEMDGNADYVYFLTKKSSVNVHSNFSYNSFVQRYNLVDYSSSIDATTGNIVISQSMEGNLRLGEGFKLYLDFGEWLFISGGGDLAYATFTRGATIKGGQPPSGNRYYTVSGNMGAEAYLPGDLKLGAYGNYNRQNSTNNRALDGYDLVTLNAAVTKFLFGKKGALTFRVNDLTNSIARRNALVDPSFLKDTPFANTTRFYTLSFSYTVNKFGKGRGGPPPARINGQPGPGRGGTGSGRSGRGGAGRH